VPDTGDRDPRDLSAETLLASLGGLMARLPVSDTVKATRAAAEVTATVLRQGQTLLDLYQQNARLREELAAATAREHALQLRAETAEAQAATFCQVIHLLTANP
jgi:hypothetical protein